MVLSKPEHSVIVAAKRTPIGKQNGMLKNFHSHELGARVVKSILGARVVENPMTGIQIIPSEAYIGTMIVAYMHRETNRVLARQNPAKETVIEADCGFINAQTVCKACSSASVAIADADDRIRAGGGPSILAGGIETMSGFPPEIIDSVLRDRFSRELMLNAAAWCAEKFKISREEQDTWAIRSFQRAQKAQADGVFKTQIVPIGGLDYDEGPLRPVDEAKIRGLLHIPGCPTITAANSCGNGDGAALCLLMNEGVCKTHGILPLARILGHASRSEGSDGKRFTVAQVPAIKAALDTVGLSLTDIDLFEIHTPFAVIGIYTTRELGIPLEKVNIHGDTIAFGHPVGATGAINVVKAVHTLIELNLRYAVISTCNTLGEAIALVIKNLFYQK